MTYRVTVHNARDVPVGIPIECRTWEDAATVSGIIAATMPGHHGVIKPQPELRIIQ